MSERTNIEDVELERGDCLVEIMPGLMLGVKGGQIGLFSDASHDQDDDTEAR